jgi:hypothetical protein
VLGYLQIILSNRLDVRLGDPTGTILYTAAIALIVLSYLALSGRWSAAGHQAPTSWRSLLWFVPLLTPAVLDLFHPVNVTLTQTLPYAVLYLVQAIQS